MTTPTAPSTVMLVTYRGMMHAIKNITNDLTLAIISEEPDNLHGIKIKSGQGMFFLETIESLEF